MGLFEQQPDPRTNEERVADEVEAYLNQQARQIVNGYNRFFNKIWLNPTPGFDPQKVLDRWDNKAVPYLQTINAIVGVVDVNALRAIPRDYTPNPDGTITLTPLSSSSESSESSESSVSSES